MIKPYNTVQYDTTDYKTIHNTAKYKHLTFRKDGDENTR